MNELKAIKKEIYEKELVHKLLESVGCHNLTIKDDEIFGSRPNGDHPRGFSVKLDEDLFCNIWTRKVPVSDIFDLISYFKFGKTTEQGIKRSLNDSKKYILKTLNLKGFNENYKKQVENDPNAWLKEIEKKKKKRIILSEIEPNKILPESTLNNFIMIPHINWIEDGIPYNIQKEFEVGFDLQTERIIFPIRNKDGKIISIKGRATKNEDRDGYKYLALYPYKKGIEWFNLHKALPYILDKKEVIIIEGEKSIMKLWHMGYKHCVSQMGSEISKVQAEILRRINPELKIILAYDKDKTVKEIKRYAEVFKNKEFIYAIYDTKNLLDEKQSPVDKGKNIWDTLYRNHCYKIFID